MEIKITNCETKESRTAKFDGAFEMGEDTQGRKCRVAHHAGISVPLMQLRSGQCGAFITGGNKYELNKEG